MGSGQGSCELSQASRLSFELAQEVWDDPLHAIWSDHAEEEDEDRWLAVGRVEPFLLLIVVHVYRMSTRGEIVRIISARKATAHERRRYEEEA